MRHQDLRVLLERGRDHHHRDVVLDVVEGAEHAAAHVEVDRAGGEQLAVVDLRAARADRHIQAVFLVDPVGHRLIEAAMLGLGLPVRAEGHLVQGLRRASERREADRQTDRRRDPKMLAHVPTPILCPPQHGRISAKSGPEG